MRPRIGVLPLQDCKKNTLWINPLYFGGIETAGGIPVLLPLSEEPELWETYIEAFDGFVFTGGQDIGSHFYGEYPLPQCGYDAPLRDRQELYLARRLMEADKPVLGICRGLQLMNVACGGTLYQDIPSQCPSPVVHRQEKPYELPHHQITVSPGSLLHRAIGYDLLSVNSMHHQAVREIAPGLVVSAIAPDGIIEALEHPGKRFYLGVQWHPEHLWQDYPSSKNLWAAFVSACRNQ